MPINPGNSHDQRLAEPPRHRIRVDRRRPRHAGTAVRPSVARTDPRRSSRLPSTDQAPLVVPRVAVGPPQTRTHGQAATRDPERLSDRYRPENGGTAMTPAWQVYEAHIKPRPDGGWNILITNRTGH